jgi:sugar transferase EpsL
VVKRALDLVLSLVALVLLSPLLCVVALAVRMTMGSPVLFRQARLGRYGDRFVIYKFRTMRPPTRPGAWFDDEERLTPIGRFLRNTSLDELPELVNVIRGDMSLVGPRPLLVEYLPLYTPEQMRRHLVRPGITGLAQVSGRNDLEWARRFELDVHYVDHQSLWLDLRILARTLPVVFRREGITAEGRATGLLFTGQAAPGRLVERTGRKALVDRGEQAGQPRAADRTGNSAG